jgi:phosphoserine aminotransferase
MINFSAGPNKLVPEVEARLRDACQAFPGSDIASWSISHRDPRVHDAFDRCVVLVKEILNVPDNFEIIFTQGGATGMFKAWPLNICPTPCTVDVVRSGHWASEAHRALQEVEAGGVIHHGTQFTGWKNVSYQTNQLRKFLYTVSNETVGGTRLSDWGILPHNTPPLIVDMSSDIMMRPIPFNRVGLVFASTQKNLGMTGGFALNIVRKDLLECDPHHLLSAPLNFKEQLKHRGGLRNTVNPLVILSILYTLEWIQEQGGVDAMAAQAQARAQLLYEAIDESAGFFEGLASLELRSTANITFRLYDEARREDFLKFCTDKGFVGLKGHAALAKVVGPHVRASCYIGTTMEEVAELVAAMNEYRQRS